MQLPNANENKKQKQKQKQKTKQKNIAKFLRPWPKPCSDFCCPLKVAHFLKKSSCLIGIKFPCIFQARSQDRIWGGVGPPQKWTFWTQNGLFEPHPLNPPTKNPFLVHIVAKRGPFGRLGVVRRTPTPPSGYGPGIFNA